MGASSSSASPEGGLVTDHRNGSVRISVPITSSIILAIVSAGVVLWFTARGAAETAAEAKSKAEAVSASLAAMQTGLATDLGNLRGDIREMKVLLTTVLRSYDERLTKAEMWNADHARRNAAGDK